MAAQKFKRPDPVEEALAENDAEIEVDAADPLTGKVNGERRAVPKRRSRSQLVPGSVTWDLNATQRLGAIVAGERGLTRRAVHNVLLLDFLALSAAERRTLIARAIEWEREMEP